MQNRIENAIVVPDFLIDQWQGYIKNFTTYSNTEYVVLKAKGALVSAIQLSEKKLVLCTPKVYQILADTYTFSRLIFDEIDTIAIPGCKQAICDFIWCVSANVDEIQNAKMANRGFLKKVTSEFKDIFKKNNHWNDLIIRTDTEYLQQSIVLPPYEIQNCSFIPKISVLTPEILERYFTIGVLVPVYETLGIKIVSSLQGLFDNVTAAQKFELELLEFGYNNEVALTNISNLEMLTRKKIYEKKHTDITSGLLSINKRILEAVREPCAISFEKISNIACVSCCHNICEGKSIIKWLNSSTSCPFCRNNCCFDDITVIDNSEKIITKEEKLIEHLNEIKIQNPDYRLIIFANDSLVKLRGLLSAEKYAVTEIRSRVVSRLLGNFQLGNPQICLINFVKHAVGLNLSFATHIIAYDDMNETTFIQCVGRSNRIGRSGALSVYRYVNM